MKTCRGIEGDPGLDRVVQDLATQATWRRVGGAQWEEQLMAKKNSLMDSPHDGFDRYKCSKAKDQAYQVVETLAHLQACCHRYFEKDSAPFCKWQKECISLYELFVKIPWFVHAKEEENINLLEAFIDTFEHAERRLRQLHESVPETDQTRLRNETDRMLNSIFRFAVYSVLLEERYGNREVPYITKTTRFKYSEDGWEVVDSYDE